MPEPAARIRSIAALRTAMPGGGYDRKIILVLTYLIRNP